MKRRVLVITGLLVALITAIYFASFLPTADWRYLYPAVRDILSGHSPYEQSGYMLPPWGVLPLLPIVLLPENFSHGMMFVICVFIVFILMWRLGVPILAAVAFLISPTAIGALLVNNVDLFVIAGIVFPPTWGLFLLVMKPQIGLGVTVYYLIEAWQSGRFLKVFKTFVPVSLVYLLSMILFPIWFDRMLHNSGNIWNRSVFPYAIPIGVFLLWLSIRKRNPNYALASALFFRHIIPFTHILRFKSV